MTDQDIAFASATSQLAMLESGEITARKLLELYVARIEQHNPRYNSVVAMDLDRARAEADACDAARAKGEELGPLAGLPITVKECFETVGMPASCGFPFLKDHVPLKDADAVKLLRDAGAIIFGKTNLPQGAADWQSFNANYGLSRNPWNDERSVGGSSGGAAAALASGFTSFELGSDIGGSIRNPAHFCGVYGHKPSYGVVPLRGHIPPMPGGLADVELAVGGPLARSAADLALLLPLLARADRVQALADPRADRLEDLRIGMWLGEGSDYLLDDGVRTAIEGFAEGLRAAGASVTAVTLPVDPQESREIYRNMLLAIIGAPSPHVAAELEECIPEDSTGLAEKILAYVRTTLPQWFTLLEKRAQLMAAWAQFFGQYDILLMPPGPVVAFPHKTDGQGSFSEQLGWRITVNGEEHPYLDFSWPGLATLANLPATLVPTGRYSDAMPVGVQVVGAFMEDLTTIRFAELAEETLGGFIPPPAVMD